MANFQLQTDLFKNNRLELSLQMPFKLDPITHGVTSIEVTACKLKIAKEGINQAVIFFVRGRIDAIRNALKNGYQYPEKTLKEITRIQDEVSKMRNINTIAGKLFYFDCYIKPSIEVIQPGPNSKILEGFQKKLKSLISFLQSFSDLIYIESAINDSKTAIQDVSA